MTEPLLHDPERLRRPAEAPAEAESRGARMAEWYRQHGRAVYNYFRFLGA
jgi:hypothetical protein